MSGLLSVAFCPDPQLGSLDPPVEDESEGEKYNEGSLGGTSRCFFLPL